MNEQKNEERKREIRWEKVNGKCAHDTETWTCYGAKSAENWENKIEHIDWSVIAVKVSNAFSCVSIFYALTHIVQKAHLPLCFAWFGLVVTVHDIFVCRNIKDEAHQVATQPTVDYTKPNTENRYLIRSSHTYSSNFIPFSFIQGSSPLISFFSILLTLFFKNFVVVFFVLSFTCEHDYVKKKFHKFFFMCIIVYS